MELSTRLDCDLVAVESADELTLLVELTAPTPTTAVTRQPATLQVVLDRSGSMQGDRLEGAKSALVALVDRLDPTDNFGLVAFDDTVQVVVPAGPLTDKAFVKQAIQAVYAGGSTDLSAGYLRGLQEAQRVVGPGGGTVLIVSDGHANAGVVDPATLGKVAKEAANQSVSTSTMGFGLGYDETLLGAIAQGGGGSELFAEEADTAVAVIAGEVDNLLAQVSQAASLRIKWTPSVAGAIINDLPVTPLPDGFQVELGSFYAGETRRLLIKLQIPGIAALGLMEVATLQLMHVSLPDLVQHSTTTPIYVNVVPGDQAAGRIRDPEVRSEALFQESQTAKRASSRMLSKGDVRGARRLLSQTSTGLRKEASTLPTHLQSELLNEAQMMESLAEEAEFDSSRAAKVGSSTAAQAIRTRGRKSKGAAYLLTVTDAAGDVVNSLELQEWELMRLERVAPAAAVIRVGVGHRVSQAEALVIVKQLDAAHPNMQVFMDGATHDGFTVERA